MIAERVLREKLVNLALARRQYETGPGHDEPMHMPTSRLYCRACENLAAEFRALEEIKALADLVLAEEYGR